MSLAQLSTPTPRNENPQLTLRSTYTGKRKRKVVYLKGDVYATRPRGLKRAMRLRKTIERAFAEGRTWHGMVRARYRGRWRAAIQVLLTFIVCNLKKMARRLAESKVPGPGMAVS